VFLGRGLAPTFEPVQLPRGRAQASRNYGIERVDSLAKRLDVKMDPLPDGATNQNPPDIGFFALLREDLRVHDNDVWEQGFWAIAVHRFGNWRMGIRFKILRAPFSILYKMLYKWVEWTCGISLPYTVKIGRRVRLWHHGGMILHAREIGDDCHIRHNTTMGVLRTNDNLAIPTIGNGVDIGCGACLLGDIHIGDDTVIGANAVVISDIPPNSIAIGIPAKVKPRKQPVSGTNLTGNNV
jgi:serine O-acetyltransferase